MSASTFTLGDDDLSFAADLYELTMAAAFHRLPSMPRATFELSVRRLPPKRPLDRGIGMSENYPYILKGRISICSDR